MAAKPKKLMHPQRFLLRKIVLLLQDADARILIQKRADSHEMELVIPPLIDAKTGAVIEYEMVYRIGASLPEPRPDRVG